MKATNGRGTSVEEEAGDKPPRYVWIGLEIGAYRIEIIILYILSKVECSTAQHMGVFDG
jgi:hypothetical protein